MEEEIKQLERIDEVFNLICKNTFGITGDDIIFYLKNNNLYYKNLHYFHVNDIIEKLEEDGYVKSFQVKAKDVHSGEDKTDWMFKASLQGKNFYARGGYLGEFERHVLSENRKNQLEKSQVQIANLTKWIALGTIIAAIYYTIEILNFFYGLKK